MIKIACVGDNCVDYYDDTKEAFPGGNPVNVAVYIKRLGGDSSYIGAVGNDEYGKLISDSLAAKGVDVSRIKTLEGSTALSHVTRVDGDRVFGDYEEGVMADFKLNESDIDYLSSFDLVVTGLWGRTENYLKEIHDKGIPVAFDGAERPFDEAGLIALPSVDIAFFSDDKATDGEIKSKILEVAAKGPKIVVATRGSIGSMAYDGEKFYECGIVKLDQVVDTMGAGDSFIAGFLLSWLKKKPILECMQDGAKNSAITIGYNGAW